MRIIILSLVCLVSLSSCKKEHAKTPPVSHAGPAMEYIELPGREVTQNKSQHIDLDNDGSRDFSFVTLHIGDPLLKRDIIQFAASSTIDRMLLMDEDDESPVFNKGEIISGSNKPGYNWHQIVLTPMAQKIMTDQEPAYWIGAWCDVAHKYLALQVVKNGQYFNGWCELSMNTTSGKMVVYRAAVCKEPQVNVKAGY